MATDTESFNRDLYDLLKVRGYNPTPLDSKNQRVSASQDADVIEFTFKKDGKDYGSAWVTIDDAQNVIIYYDSEQQESPSAKSPGVDYDDSWTGLLKFLKNWSQRRQMSFELANKDRLGDDMRQRDYYKMKEKLGESYHPMGKKASYNDAVPSVKIILQHNRSLDEGEQRYRNVARIFLENQDGERFLAPTNKPGLARVYARHIAEGGLPNDERWNHIKSICEDYSNMAGFVRATKNKQFNESAQELVNEGVNHYNNLRETLHKLAGHRGYQAYFESWTPTLMEGDDEDISEMFMSQSLDPRIESAMPILSRLKKPVTEMEEIDSLSEWADDIINEKMEMDSTTKTMAVPADEMLDEAPGAETLAHNQSTAKSNLKAFGLAEDTAEYLVSLLPKHNPIKIKAKSRDDAAEQAAEKWGVPAVKITVQGVDDGITIPSKADTPDDGTALSRAEKRAKEPKPAWYTPFVKAATGIHEGEVEENLDANQKRVGQVGATEKAKNISPVLGKEPKQHPFQGKLVGASESKGMDPELARIIKMAKFKR
jgi:uncharacterized protein YihD (DUF1040 family)